MRRRLRVLRSWLWIALLWSCTPGCGSQQLDAADPRAVLERVEHVTPLLASELIALCVPPSDDFETRRHCDRMRELFDYLVAGGERP